MKMPCQMVVWYLLPAINAALTREMKELGMRNSEIAQALDITPSAVSQYLSSKRGSDVSLGRSASSKVSELARRIHRGALEPQEMLSEICSICATARSEGVMCAKHVSVSALSKGCTMCTEVR